MCGVGGWRGGGGVAAQTRALRGARGLRAVPAGGAGALAPLPPAFVRTGGPRYSAAASPGGTELRGPLPASGSPRAGRCKPAF